jgi:hypothetical protein
MRELVESGHPMLPDQMTDTARSIYPKARYRCRHYQFCEADDS